MQARSSRLAALTIAIFVAAMAVVTTVPSASASTGATVAAADAKTCQRPPPRNDDTIHFTGCLLDQRTKPPKPVPDVTINVEDSSNKVVGTGKSDETGIFDIPLPGKSIDNLGKTFTVKIDTDTLPKGTALRNPKQVSLDRTLNLDSDVFVAFPIGNDSSGSTSKGVQALQLLVGGLVFSLLLAMAALGLSMIFGTTGLTNFSHGELITFGALVAYGVDSLPGTITIGSTNVTLAVAAIVATIASAGFGWLNDWALWRPLRRRGTGLVAAMVVSIGLSIFLRNLYQYFAGASNHQYSQFSSPKPYHWGPVLVTPKDIFVDRVISVVWIVGAMLAGLSGVLFGMTQGFDYQLGFKLLLLVFAATVLGGLGTASGAIVGAIVIGLFVEVSTLIIPPELKFVGGLLVLIIVLLFRPQGLLGKPQRVG